MARPGNWGALAGCALLALTLGTGCLGFVHPVDPLPPKNVFRCEGVPQACKNRVHVFVVHGIDPLDLANLDGLCDYLHELGFIKTHFGLPYHAYQFDREIRKIHEEDPEVRFVVIGFNYGAGIARDLACSAGVSKIPIDLLVYLDGLQLAQRPLDRPGNALRVLNVLTKKGSPTLKIAKAVNAECDDVWHFGAPTHPHTLKLLAGELAQVAARVPIVEVALPPLHHEPTPHGLPAPTPAPDNRPRLPAPLPGSGGEKLPQPKEVPPGKAKADGWDFLEPDGGSPGVPGAKPISEGVSSGAPAMQPQ
jgi:hypothetical protein